MKVKITLLVLLLLCTRLFIVQSQTISDFISVEPIAQTQQFIIPSSHKFQKIIETGDALTAGGQLPVRSDFTAYVPILNSAVNGYLSINSENAPGGVTVLDINFNATTKLWEKTASEAIDFTAFFGTAANCSGTVTSWNTVISSEEFAIDLDQNADGYNDFGWNIEIDPATKTVLAKHWAMGNFKHENVTIHSNERTVYQGADSDPGYLYKFVATTAQDLSDGLLYVYKGSKSGSGNWMLLQNTTPADRNSTITQSETIEATVFQGIEDVEIGPDGMVYFAVKGEGQIYRFLDSDPISGTTATMETYVGNASYAITHSSGTTVVPWGNGNDNLAFDGNDNLWVLQDGGDHYIWVVENGHTQATPKVKIFGIAPIDSEPTGITFTPDYNYLFMSIQHPNSTNDANQPDVEGTILSFSKGTALVIGLNENLGGTLSIGENSTNTVRISPNPIKIGQELIIKAPIIHTVKVFSIQGSLLIEQFYNEVDEVHLPLKNVVSGLYMLQINNSKSFKLLVE